MSEEDDWRRGLIDLAWAAGVEPRYYDIGGELHHASVETLLAVLFACGVPVEKVADVPGAWAWWHERVAGTVVEPVIPAREGHPLSFRLRFQAAQGPDSVEVVLRFEDGTETSLGTVSLAATEHKHVWHGPIETVEHWLSVDAPRPVGYHQLLVDTGAEVFESTVLSAPSATRSFTEAERVWGAFAPVYSLRGDADLGSFDDVAAWVAAQGGSVMATLPLLASFLDEPFDPSPYTPVSRRFWNELFVDLDRLGPRFAGAGVDQSWLRDELGMLDHGPAFDYRRRARLVHSVLAQLAKGPDVPGGEGRPDELGEVDRYAQFRAVGARQRSSWREWPTRARAGDLKPGDFDPSVARMHVVAQEAMREQLLDLAGSMRARGQRLYLDLPIGAHPAGFDTWNEPDLFASGVSVGAPPDDFFAGGQDWGFPPMLPEVSRTRAHGHFRTCLRHHMEVAGILRLDHVMALHRLYWVPDGLAATEGAYVRYPRDELFAVLAIESQRHDCIVVGEDLGTVPDEVRAVMADNEVSGMYVAEFAIPSWEGAEPHLPSPRSVASVGSHDTPTFSGFLHGADIAFRAESELLEPDVSRHELEARWHQVENLRRFLHEQGLQPGDDSSASDDHSMLVGVLELLGASDASCVLVALEDLWGEAHPQNIPGTPLGRPNWVQRFPYRLDQIASLAEVKRALAVLDRARKETS